MALTIDTTLGGKSSNSYVDVAYCDDYWNDHYSSTKAALWSALTIPRKTTLLINACKVLNTLRCTIPHPHSSSYESQTEYSPSQGKVISWNVNRQPVKYYWYQALQFPRNLDTDVDTGALFIPESIKIAQCEQAIYLLSLDETVLANALQGIESDSLGVGPVRVSQTLVGRGSAVSPVAVECMREFLIRSSGKLRRA